MARSLHKGPYVAHSLIKKLSIVKGPIRTWSRSSMIIPEFVGRTFEVHDGKSFKSVIISDDMIGYKLGQFAPTRKFTGHSGDRKVK